jgi:plastocyanin
MTYERVRAGFGAHSHYRWSPALLFTALVAIAALTAACGDHDTSDDFVVLGGNDETIEMDGSKFKPGNLQVPVGASVTWTNNDSAPHDAQAEDGSWMTPTLEDGDSETLTFHDVGEWFYKCTIHPSMKARITVVESTT